MSEPVAMNMQKQFNYHQIMTALITVMVGFMTYYMSHIYMDWGNMHEAIRRQQDSHRMDSMQHAYEYRAIIETMGDLKAGQDELKGQQEYLREELIENHIIKPSDP